jgi:hypothetical protein
MSYNRNMSKAVVFGPREYEGIGLRRFLQSIHCHWDPSPHCVVIAGTSVGTCDSEVSLQGLKCIYKYAEQSPRMAILDHKKELEAVALEEKRAADELHRKHESVKEARHKELASWAEWGSRILQSVQTDLGSSRRARRLATSWRRICIIGFGRIDISFELRQAARAQPRGN